MPMLFQNLILGIHTMFETNIHMMEGTGHLL